MSPFGTTSDLVPYQKGNQPNKENPLARLKPIDRLTDQTTPTEFDQTVFEYLNQKFGLPDKSNPAYELIRDSILYTTVFATSPATFDELAAGNILLPTLPGVRNMHAIMALLEDFGVVQYAGDVDEKTTRVWAEHLLRQEIYSRLKDTTVPVPVALHEALIHQAIELTTHRYSVNQETKNKLNAILSKYEE